MASAPAQSAAPRVRRRRPREADRAAELKSVRSISCPEKELSSTTTSAMRRKTSPAHWRCAGPDRVRVGGGIRQLTNIDTRIFRRPQSTSHELYGGNGNQISAKSDRGGYQLAILTKNGQGAARLDAHRHPDRTLSHSALTIPKSASEEKMCRMSISISRSTRHCGRRMGYRVYVNGDGLDVNANDRSGAGAIYLEFNPGAAPASRVSARAGRESAPELRHRNRGQRQVRHPRD